MRRTEQSNDCNRASLTASGFPTGTGTFNGLTSFVYDARDELTGETSARDSGYSAPFIYDGVTMNTTTGPGNATSERSVAFTFDAHGDNQIATDGGHYSWTYDGDGNPVTYLSKTDAFDPENRMTAYAIPAGGGHATLTMGYDDDGMRAWKKNSSSTRTYFLYDGSDLIAELTSAGALGTYETTGADGVVSRRAGITTTYFAFDPEGSVSAVLNYTGTVRGDELFEANGHADSSYRDRPVDFGGQWGYYGDSETGLTLLGHRYYDSYAGRFLTRDPIGYNGGVNLYSYTANNFENRSDPSGFIDPVEGNHVFPKFLGGPEKQDLTNMSLEEHDQFHRDLDEFLDSQKNAEGKSMRSCKGNPGRVIRQNFTAAEREEAMAKFYRGPGAKYTEAAKNFFRQFARSSPEAQREAEALAKARTEAVAAEAEAAEAELELADLELTIVEGAAVIGAAE